MLLEHSALEVYYVEVHQYHGYLDEVLVWYDKFLVAPGLLDSPEPLKALQSMRLDGACG